MTVRLVLLVLCLAAVAALSLNPAWADARLVAVLGVLASLLLILLRLLGPAPEAPWIVVDGSNVMYWKDGTPQAGTVRDVVARLVALGYAPGVMFDANAGHLLEGAYRHDGAFARMLDLPPDRVMVVPKGTQADGYILQAARDLGARIVTNDRFRDWIEQFPEVRQPGHLVRGNYRDGALWLDLADPAAARPDRPALQTVSR